MMELPLFPLDTVLFPGGPLHLHIFEERYKLMIGMCLQQRQPFGVVLIRQGQEAQGPLAEPYQVGCAASIINVQRLEQGRMNIFALGTERFRILSLDQTSFPYLVGTVDRFPIMNAEPPNLIDNSERLRRQVERFIQSLMKAGGGEFDLSQLPDDPVLLAYTAATLLQIPSVEKQVLLESEHSDVLLERLSVVYKREIALLQAVLEERGRAQGSFSVN
jgi:Lon protease-like protein